MTCFNSDSEKAILEMKDESVDIICIDPPYLYLKNQKLERPFDETRFFKECKRILTKNGFIIMFGRGSSFYRWNTILDSLGFIFKEEIVWDKKNCSSPLMSLSRVHETISIHCKNKGKINKVKIPYLEQRANDVEAVAKDIKRLKSVFTQAKSFQAVLSFLEKNLVDFSSNKCMEQRSMLRNGDCKENDRCVTVMNSIENGMNEKSIIRTDMTPPNNPRKGVTCEAMKPTGDRCVNVVNSIMQGMNEKSIIKQVRDHYSSIHPTQKPVRLLERLIQLCLPDKPKNEITVVDFFAGSFSCAEACHNLGVNFIGYEIDEEYFNLGKERVDKLELKLNL